MALKPWKFVLDMGSLSYRELIIAPGHLEAIGNKLQPLYNTVHYNTVLDITRFKDGLQKCIDYIEK